jgi:hypothetical protein
MPLIEDLRVRTYGKRWALSTPMSTALPALLLLCEQCSSTREAASGSLGYHQTVVRFDSYQSRGHAVPILTYESMVNNLL